MSILECKEKCTLIRSLLRLLRGLQQVVPVEMLVEMPAEALED